jgi:hypothetical protein
MAISLSQKRVVGVLVETTRGTHNDPAAADCIPLLRSAKFTIRPTSVDRPTLRLSLTDMPDIYPGKSLADVEFSFELHANSTYVQGAGTTSAMRPLITRMLQGAGYTAVSGEANDMVAFDLASPAATDNGPLRHGEVVTGTGTTGTWNVFGDTYADDGALFVDRGTGTFTGTTFTGATSASIFTVGTTPEPTKIFGWNPNSSPQVALSITVWADGKRLRIKGSVGNISFAFRHGDAIIATCNFSGIVVDYGDSALPTSPNEAHKYPPTFLGTRATFRQAINAPSSSNKYGSDGGGTGVIAGALNSIDLESGNAIVFHENSMDPNGVNYGQITARQPKGKFNPDEMANSTEFAFVSRFLAGTPIRGRIWTVGPGTTTWAYDDPTTQNQNGFDFIMPGMVFSGLADQERDGINVWDASFDLTGTDYNSGLEEAIGTDNELVLVHR